MRSSQIVIVLDKMLGFKLISINFTKPHRIFLHRNEWYTSYITNKTKCAGIGRRWCAGAPLKVAMGAGRSIKPRAPRFSNRQFNYK